MKRLLALLLACVMLLGLTACGGKEEPAAVPAIMPDSTILVVFVVFSIRELTRVCF